MRARSGVFPRRVVQGFSWCRRKRAAHRLGFTLLEMVLSVMIIGIIIAIGIPQSMGIVHKARVARAIGDIEAIQAELVGFQSTNNLLPATLVEIGRSDLEDPWGNPYQYNLFDPSRTVPQGARRDRFNVPINTEFDLFSAGPDGESRPALNSPTSRDDIIRANDGGFVGLAETY